MLTPPRGAGPQVLGGWMSPAPALPRVLLARHGQTAWSLSGQHTGLTDLPLTATGEAEARSLAARLHPQRFVRVLCSPLQRAWQTCELAGFGTRAETRRAAGRVGLRRLRRQDQRADPGAAARLAAVPRRLPAAASRAGAAARRQPDRTLRSVAGDVLLFSSGHFLRMLTARWLGLEPGAGALLGIDTASLGVLGYEHRLQQPVIRLWNDTAHVDA